MSAAEGFKFKFKPFVSELNALPLKYITVSYNFVGYETIFFFLFIYLHKKKANKRIIITINQKKNYHITIIFNKSSMIKHLENYSKVISIS